MMVKKPKENQQEIIKMGFCDAQRQGIEFCEPVFELMPRKVIRTITHAVIVPVVKF